MDVMDLMDLMDQVDVGGYDAASRGRPFVASGLRGDELQLAAEDSRRIHRATDEAANLLARETMPFALEALCRIRPYLYHLTAACNLPRIAASRRLQTAEVLMSEAGDLQFQRERRPANHSVRVGGAEICLRNQRPLHKGNLALPAGESFADFVELLNRHVFFWPGWEKGPIDYGVRHFEANAHEHPVILRAKTADVLGANPRLAPRFCKYNSGSPRWSGGRPSPRGLDVFVVAEEADFSAGYVVEVVFRGDVVLPSSAEHQMADEEGWRPI